MLDSNPVPSPEVLTVNEILEQKSDVLVTGLTEEGSLSSTLAQIDTRTGGWVKRLVEDGDCLLYTSPSPRDKRQSRMPSSA